MKHYKALNKQAYSVGIYSIVPIRFEDRMDIMNWRNEQIYHLRQSQPLTIQDQDNYFNTVINQLFEVEKPNQLLFSYLENDKCIGYGGLVHINWIDKNAEISFVMNTKLEKDMFKFHWGTFLQLLENIAFIELNFHKIFTYAFDLRPHLYEVLESNNYLKEAVLNEHCFFNNQFIDVIIHSKKISEIFFLREASLHDAILLFDWVNDKDVRLNSINQATIIWENHLKWLENRLNRKDTFIYILSDGEINYGQIRIDKDNNWWMIDYSIDVNHRGKGFGTLIVNLLIEKCKNFNFKAFVKESNLSSIHVFVKLGFNEVNGELENMRYFEKIQFDEK